jgi:hypothetical protein
MLSMLRSPWLMLFLFYNFAIHFAGVCARVASLEPFAEPPPVTEAPGATLGKLYKRDSPLCGYFDGIARKSDQIRHCH